MLAAGDSRRFGGDKRQALLADGRSLLNASLHNAIGVFSPLILVLRAQDDPVALGVPAQVQVVRNLQAAQGMASSLVAGMRMLSAQAISGPDAVAILLADMPCIERTTLNNLAALASPESIVVPSYQGQRGHPVIFGRAFWPELMSLAGDAGAREIVRQHRECVKVLQVQDPGVCIDIDDSEALAGLWSATT